MWSRDVLREGLFWKIGDGSSINIRGEKWILSTESGRVTSNCPQENLTKVADLMSSPTSWDMDKLRKHFLPYKVEAILKVPLLGYNTKDSLFWKLDKKGCYSVKSGYWNYFLHNRENGNGETSGSCSSKTCSGIRFGPAISHQRLKFLFGR